MYARTAESPTGSVATTARVDHFRNGALAIRMSSHLVSRTLTVFRILFQELNRSLVATHRYEELRKSDAALTFRAGAAGGPAGRDKCLLSSTQATDCPH